MSKRLIASGSAFEIVAGYSRAVIGERMKTGIEVTAGKSA